MYLGKAACDTAAPSNESHRVSDATVNAIIQAVYPRTDRFVELMTCVARESSGKVCMRAHEESHHSRCDEDWEAEAMMKGLRKKC